MNKLLELIEKRERLWNDAKDFLAARRQDNGLLSSEDEKTYNYMVESVFALCDEICRLKEQAKIDMEIGLLKEQAKIDREIDNPEVPKPVLGIKPYYVAAWQRIGELAEAIERQYQSPNGDTELVQKWAAEIGWQCSMIESLKDVET